MSRKFTIQEARQFFDSMPTQWSHCGYLIRYNDIHSIFYISKDGHHIGSAPTIDCAKREINYLVQS